MDHISEIMAVQQSHGQKSHTSEAGSILTASFHRVGPPGYEHCDWAGVQNAEKAASVFDRLFDKNNPAPRFPIYLTGDVGRGKTGLAAVLYRIAKRPIWRRADSFLLDLSQGRGDDTYRSEIRKAAEASLLVLDDLGVRRPSEGMFHLLFDVLELRKTKPTVITSNKTLDELCEVYTDGRIYSRLAAGTIMTLIGEDRRIGDDGCVVYQI
jgi:DNA replication protein DnaC